MWTTSALHEVHRYRMNSRPGPEDHVQQGPEGKTLAILSRRPEIVWWEKRGWETGSLPLGHLHFRKRKEAFPCWHPPGCQAPCEMFHIVSNRHIGNRPNGIGQVQA
jgi:hypothetical protein